MVKDILFSLIQQTHQDVCFRCGQKLTRETFSIEHKQPWLNENNAKELFFELTNITFSHLKCNVASRRIKRLPCGTLASYSRGCRCEKCTDARAESARNRYDSKTRQRKYIKTGN